MKINLDFLLILMEMFKGSTFDEELFNNFAKTKAARCFIQHENYMGKESSKKDIRDELIRIISFNNYKDRYKMYRIKKEINQLSRDIKYIKKNKELIIKMALKKVYEIVPRDMKIRTNIYLYFGGIDGGFTINRKDIFINYGNYLGEMDEFIKILSHELYHSRTIPLKKRIGFALKFINKKNGHIYSILGKSVEEGIACLIQHGSILTKDDRTGNLTKRSLRLSKIQFNILNNIFLDIKSNKYNKETVKQLNIYAIGYIIVTTIYNEGEYRLLDDWTVNLEFKGIIKKYMEISKESNSDLGISLETIDGIIY